ncbi:hypothetical protein TrCOL_g891 [Triparma columacea]|uniref:Uncharacterized protein n=1 Tax=Triparma columacea TaxID=722753 RepID=A0A9W7GLW8_9STRA|nr:hypothetical protein TrCOL_g891 [Triparma columacea]
MIPLSYAINNVGSRNNEMDPSDMTAFINACEATGMTRDSDFNVVVNYLATFPDIDSAVGGLINECGLIDSFVQRNDLSLLRSSVMIHISGYYFTDSGSGGEAKRMLVAMVLLAGASTDDPDLGEYGGLEIHMGINVDWSFVEGLLALCVSTPAERKEKWPETVAELVAASADRDQQLKIVMRAFVENCGSDTSEEAIRALVVFE